MQNSRKLEALLLYKGEPIHTKELLKLLNISEGELLGACTDLEKALAGRGIQLVRNNDSYALATAPETAELILALEREEHSSELSRPALETLALIVYEGPLPKSKIDYVRGVNATFILRSLMTRGLVERITDPVNARQTLYQATIELLGHLGITQAEELPEYEATRELLRERLTSAEGSDARHAELTRDLETDPDFDKE